MLCGVNEQTVATVIFPSDTFLAFSISLIFFVEEKSISQKTVPLSSVLYIFNLLFNHV